jgi:hypothetical protein
MLAAAVAGGCNFFGGSDAITEVPAELVIWGDPDPDSDVRYMEVYDVNELAERFIAVGTNGQLQFSNGEVCRTCSVVGSTVSLDGVPRMYIRYSVGADGEGSRRPFLVSTDGFYIELVATDQGISFVEEAARFEADDNLDDDLAERVGTVTNPALAGTSS